MKTAQKLTSRKFAFSLIAGGLFFSTLILTKSLVFAQTENTEPELSNEGESIFEETNVPEVTNLTETKSIEFSDPSQVTLTAIPPRLGEDNSLKALPGEKLQVQLRVRNQSEQRINVLSSAQDFIISEDGKTPIAIDDSTSNRWSLASWLTITPAENSIAPNETIGLNLLIEIPEDALPGGHYAMVLHQPANKSGDFTVAGNSQSAINQKVGTLLYVIVDGPINEEAYVRNFTFPKFTEYGPVPFSFTIENNSDIHIAPRMNVEIFNIFNKKIDTIQVDSKNVFPISSRDFEGRWEKIWGTGLYKAKLTMSFGTAGAVVVANSMFWLLPVKLLIAVIFILLTIIILVISIKRHLKHRKDVDAKRIQELESQIQNMSHEESDQNDTPQA